MIRQIRIGRINPCAAAVMAEIGIDLTGHQSKRFGNLANEPFDLVVSSAPERSRFLVWSRFRTENRVHPSLRRDMLFLKTL